LKAINALEVLCDARVAGARVGSKRVSFKPGQIKSGRFKVDIGTAGSTTLLIQALLPVALSSKGNVEIEARGGTDVKWSPPIDYFKDVFCYFLCEIGVSIECEVKSRGFYPQGGGCVTTRVKPWVEKNQLELTDRGKLRGIYTSSIATSDLKKPEVVEKQVKGFLKEVSPHHEVAGIKRGYVDCLSTGSVLNAYAEYEHARVGASTLGERGLRAEEVGRKTAHGLFSMMDLKSPLDSHMTDQIIPYLALAKGRIKAGKITNHCETNVWVAKRFGFNLEITGNEIISR
jgi:RNA 3'-phosphate cyclase